MKIVFIFNVTGFVPTSQLYFTVTILSPWKLNHCILQGNIINTEAQQASTEKLIWYRIALYFIAYHRDKCMNQFSYFKPLKHLLPCQLDLYSRVVKIKHTFLKTISIMVIVLLYSDRSYFPAVAYTHWLAHACDGV